MDAKDEQDLIKAIKEIAETLKSIQRDIHHLAAQADADRIARGMTKQ
jgi:archaellum component FlaC